jgi:hypothetical protein
MGHWPMDDRLGLDPAAGNGVPPGGSSTMAASHQRSGYAAPEGLSQRG